MWGWKGRHRQKKWLSNLRAKASKRARGWRVEDATTKPKQDYPKIDKEQRTTTRSNRWKLELNRWVEASYQSYGRGGLATSSQLQKLNTKTQSTGKWTLARVKRALATDIIIAKRVEWRALKLDCARLSIQPYCCNWCYFLALVVAAILVNAVI